MFAIKTSERGTIKVEVETELKGRVGKNSGFIIDILIIN